MASLVVSRQSDEDLPFQHYSKKHQVVAWISSNLFDGLTYTVRHGLLKGMKRKGGLAWLPFGGKESAEHRFLRSLDLQGKTVFDVGAFHGLLSMWFAQSAKQVYAFEPTSANRQRLTENILLNGLQNVSVQPYGLGSRDGLTSISYSPLMPGGAAITGANGYTDVIREEIEVRRLDVCSLPNPDLIKIDTEGAELDVLRGALRLLREHHPALYIEMHGETMIQKRAKVRAIVEFLKVIGYGSIYHVESGSQINLLNTNIAAQGHLYCTA